MREERKHVVREKYEWLKSHLGERGKWAANEALSFGPGGVRAVAEALQMSTSTILEGKRELSEKPRPADSGVVGGRQRRPEYRIRRPGGGRKLIEEKDPTIVAALERLLTDEVAGDPMTEQKWFRSSLSRLSERLADEGHQASGSTISRPA